MKNTDNLGTKNIIGLRIRAAREALTPSVSQEELAIALGHHGISIDRSAISRIERQNRSVSDYEIAAIARCLNISIASLFEE